MPGVCHTRQDCLGILGDVNTGSASSQSQALAGVMCVEPCSVLSLELDSEESQEGGKVDP